MRMTLQWHRRHAITIASQLPDNPEDALLVLEEARLLVQSYLVGVPEEEPEHVGRAPNVLPFGVKN
jgi:hypothetical protein